MKLKHFLQKYSLDFYLHPNIIEAVEEWLKQKLDEIKTLRRMNPSGYLWFDDQKQTIEELLEELKEK